MRVCKHLENGVCSIGVSPPLCRKCSMFILLTRDEMISRKSSNHSVAVESSSHSVQEVLPQSTQKEIETTILKAAQVKGGCNCRK